MVWTAPVTFVANDVLTAAQLNTFLGENMMETAPGKATRENRLICATGVNALEERQWARDYASQAGVITVDSQFPSNEDLGENEKPSVSVTVHHGGKLLVMMDVGIRVSAGSGNAMAGLSIDGTMPESSNYAVRSGRNRWARIGTQVILSVEPGISTIEMVYGTSNTSTTAQYRYRRIAVQPL